MEGDAGAQVAAPLSLFRHTSCSAAPSPFSKKKHSPQEENATSDQYQVRVHQFNMISAAAGNRKVDWKSRMWGWDSVMFVEKPSSYAAPANKKAEDLNTSANGSAEEGESLSTEMEKLSPPIVMDDQLVRPHKKVRPGAQEAGIGIYPVCQVDDCKVDLSKAKDYYRRHKVCDLHSKIAKAWVTNQMQRFCQQCSRFHSLSEFDEGKRSCRHRLAGHNHRRRKVQPEDVPSCPLPNEQSGLRKKNSDIVNLISILSSLQGSNVDPAINCSAIANRIQQTQVFNKIKYVSATNSSARLTFSKGFDLNMSDHQQSAIHKTLENGRSSTPTLDLLGVLSAALDASESDNITPQRSSDNSSDDIKLRDYIGPLISDSPSESAPTHPHAEVEGGIPDQISSVAVRQSPLVSRSTLPLQLFNSVEDDKNLNVLSSKKYLKPHSSVPLGVMSPLSSPFAQKLFSPHSATEILSNGRMQEVGGHVSMVSARANPPCSSSLSLWND